MTIKIELLESLSDDDRAAIVMPLDDFSRARDFAFSPETIAIALRDDGRVVGGLIGQLSWDWLHIQILGVPDNLRGQNYGRSIVTTAERRAAARGCVGAWVDTFTFQSPGFYERLGYQCFGELPNYPRDERRIFLRKSLEAGRIGG